MQINQLSKQYHVIGMMSGTSLDGIDLSLARYQKKNKTWTFQILACKTFSYDVDQVKLLRQIQNQKLTFLEFHQKQLQYSEIIVNAITKFLDDNKSKIAKIYIDAISIHGHTIYHNPKQSLTVQIANLQYIAAKLRINVIGNFRQLDIHRGGQGAPLAPFGQELFGNYIFLNFGGIANVGYKGIGNDIVFCNLVLNKYSQKIENKTFDQNGEIGCQGHINEEQLQKLLQKFSNNDKHSLARQQIQQFLKQIQISELPKQQLKDKMRTFYEFISIKIIESIVSLKIEYNPIEVYCTGGGALNKYLISILNKNKHNISFILPNQDIINFKQALIFGLLGVKFLLGEQNCCNGTGGQLIKGQILQLK